MKMKMMMINIRFLPLRGDNNSVKK